MHRTSFYKKTIKRSYKYEYLKEDVLIVFNNSMQAYGSLKISKELESKNIQISDRTLRNYMNRWDIHTKTRDKKTEKWI